MPESRGGFSSAPPSAANDPFGGGTGRRNELPGAVAGNQSAPAMDIRAILRGEAGPRGALPPSSGSGADPTAVTLKPALAATGPLRPLGTTGPLGGKAFNPALLELRMLKPDPEAVSGRLTIPSAFPASGRLSIDVPAGVQPRAAEPLDNLDATHLMDDFDLPDAGFETHVFSTAELVDDEAILPPELLRAMPPKAGAPAPTFSMPITEYPAEPRAPKPRDDRDMNSMTLAEYQDYEGPEEGTIPLSDLSYLSPSQESQARRQLDEIGQMADVLFVKLMAGDGSVMLETGTDGGDDRANQYLAEITSTSLVEAQQHDLGDVAGITIESAQGVLVLSPLLSGAVLVILLGNPARLGMLRRQLKKPVGNLRGVLMESSVS
jgi:predicted regulator of Ras-like GTPase activity (Roadblock/LC7/MglB family)